MFQSMYFAGNPQKIFKHLGFCVLLKLTTFYGKKSVKDNLLLLISNILLRLVTSMPAWKYYCYKFQLLDLFCFLNICIFVTHSLLP